MPLERWKVRLACSCSIMVTTGMPEAMFLKSIPATLHCGTHKRQSVVDAYPLPLSPMEEVIAQELLAEHRAKKAGQ